MNRSPFFDKFLRSPSNFLDGHRSRFAKKKRWEEMALKKIPVPRVEFSRG